MASLWDIVCYDMYINGKICYGASKKHVISWWTSQEHEFAIGKKYW